MEIAARAAGQHGLVTLCQLRDLGLSSSGVRARVDEGSLHRVHEGVYAVGHIRLDVGARYMGAVLACGPGALLSHRSSAALWGLRRDGRASIDVTAPNRRGRQPRGIDAHRNGLLASSDRTRRDGIPCTTVERTLVDLAGVVSVPELRKAVSEAEVLRLLDHGVLRGVIRRCRGRRGVARLRMVLDEIRPEVRRTRSEMERLFLRMCSRAGLPTPAVNAPLMINGATLRPDFMWREAGLIVESDGRRFHDTHSAFQRDRWREQEFQLAGWRVIHCTWEQIEREPRRLAATIRGLLELATQ